MHFGMKSSFSKRAGFSHPSPLSPPTYPRSPLASQGKGGLCCRQGSHGQNSQKLYVQTILFVPFELSGCRSGSTYPTSQKSWASFGDCVSSEAHHGERKTDLTGAHRILWQRGEASARGGRGGSSLVIRGYGRPLRSPSSPSAVPPPLHSPPPLPLLAFPTTTATRRWRIRTPALGLLARLGHRPPLPTRALRIPPGELLPVYGMRSGRASRVVTRGAKGRERR